MIINQPECIPLEVNYRSIKRIIPVTHSPNFPEIKTQIVLGNGEEWIYAKETVDEIRTMVEKEGGTLKFNAKGNYYVCKK